MNAHKISRHRKYFAQWLTEPAHRVASEELIAERRAEEMPQSKPALAGKPKARR